MKKKAAEKQSGDLSRAPEDLDIPLKSDETAATKTRKGRAPARQLRTLTPLVRALVRLVKTLERLRLPDRRWIPFNIR